LSLIIEDSVARIEDGTHLVSESEHSLTQINTEIKKVSDIIADDFSGICRLNEPASSRNEGFD